MQEKDKVLKFDHDYDGILEYDNPSPAWWNYLFYITIVFSICYLAYHLGKASALSPAYPNEPKRAWSVSLFGIKDKKAMEELAKRPVEALEGEKLLAYLKNDQPISHGRKLFAEFCVSCHGDKGQGLVGPNLTDEYWIKGEKPEEIIAAIAEGSPEKGMQAWEPQMGLRKVRDLAAFVISIKGSSPPDPKAPEGEKQN